MPLTNIPAKITLIQANKPVASIAINLYLPLLNFLLSTFLFVSFELFDLISEDWSLSIALNSSIFKESG